MQNLYPLNVNVHRSMNTKLILLLHWSTQSKWEEFRNEDRISFRSIVGEQGRSEVYFYYLFNFQSAKSICMGKFKYGKPL